ncbi:T9SS type A sorting domain-containing protein [Chryseobacterium sp. Marseille-Q3244]|uniref:T9SS type A sorting domain-containing protein n=1 Tax=Chryseobacterium sp. Marseille-Q3244 TaxID=2758092 RepID=UPI002023F07E|nr:T9SS type A sorting domain-containing protein [Chryseobacterium sp. Marseille-Q3244]
MKKIYFTFLIVTMAKLMAQPVISADHAIQPGTTTYQHADPTTLGSLAPGPSGANVSWDFSQYSSSATTSQTMYNCPGNANCSDFPGANKMSASSSGNSYSYMLYSNNELSVVGNKTVGTGGATSLYTFDDPKLELKFPVTYLQSFTDSWTAHSTPAGTSETGNHTVTVDAYGTLKTPLGTFPNTLRMKRVMNISTNVTGSPFTSSVIEMYTWISSGYSGALLTIAFADTTVTGYPTVHSRSLSYGNNNLVLSADDIKVDRKINIFPNPSSDFITIKNNELIDKVELSNAEGRKIYESDKADKVDISGFPLGVYYLKMSFKDGKTQIRKVIKK